jgi:homopolymeric O-antigen transport system permease protein
VSVAEISPSVRLYEKDSLGRRAATEVRELFAYRELVRYLVRSDLRSSTTDRVFGFIWWLLDPLLLMATYVILVKVIFHRGAPNYPVLVFSSVLAFRFFAQGIAGAMGRTVGGHSMMKQVRFPPTVFPLAAVTTQLFRFAFGVAVLFVFALPFHIYPAPMDLMLIPITAILFVLVLGIGYFLSAVNVFMRDLQNLMAYVFRMMFFLSTAIYSLSQVPANYRTYYLFNPLTTVFESYHDVIIYHQFPHAKLLGALAAASLVLLCCGFLVFVSLERVFNKVL